MSPASDNPVDVRTDAPRTTTVHTQTGIGGTQTEISRTTTPDPTPSLAARAAGLGGYDTDVRRVAGAALISLVAGLVLFGIGAWQNWVAATVWAGACSALGWFTGFLFGIPRTLSTEGQSAAITQTATEAPAGDRTTKINAKRLSGVNTNLEQISDWLTKILVGVTLVQLDEVGGTLDAGATLIAQPLGGDASGKSFAYALIVYFTLVGFLGSYLLTRLFLQRALQEAAEGE